MQERAAKALQSKIENTCPEAYRRNFKVNSQFLQDSKVNQCVWGVTSASTHFNILQFYERLNLNISEILL